MSRCFPFPPPGYEKKIKIDDTDLLTKEKHKEKKHRKDKKDKDKRERKEKKDRDRSKGKNGEIKDRKEKRKDKKERKGDKQKNETPNEKRGEVKLDCRNGEKLAPNGQQNLEVKDSKYVQDLDYRIKKDNGATGSQVVQKITGADKRGAEFPNHFEGRERIKEKKQYDWKVENIQRNYVEERHLANSIVPNFSTSDQKRVDGVSKLLDKIVEKQMEGRGENKHKESARQENKPKDKGEEEKINSKDKARNKEKEKEEKTKDINRPKAEIKRSSIKQPRQVKSGKDPVDISNAKQVGFSQMNGESSHAVGILGKRKELQINGDLHGNGFLPHKLPRSASSQPAMENGRKLEPCQTAIQFASNNCKVGIEEQRINGLRGPEVPVKKSPSSSSTVKVKENGEASMKPPHTDSKYLSLILSVPKMGEWSDYDDQEWLFNSTCLQPKKPKEASPGVEEIPQVWAEASQIQSADLFALPYVIPY